MKNFSVVILSAGVGKRLYPLTEEYHKSLVPINGRPNLINTLDILEKRARSIVIVTNENSFQDHLEIVRSRKWRCKVNVRTNPNALNTNTVTSMLYGLNEIRGNDINKGVLILEGDQIYDAEELDRMIRKWNHRKSAYFTQYRVNEWRVVTTQDNRVVGVDVSGTGNCMAGVAFLSKKMALAYEKSTYGLLSKDDNNQRYWEEFVIPMYLKNKDYIMYDHYSERGYSSEYDNLYDLYCILGHDKFLDLFDHYEPLDGMTNRTYKVTVNDKNYVLKIPGAGTGEFINRHREKIMTEIFNQNQISPKVTYSEDISIVEYLETSRIVKPTVNDMVRAAKIIGRTHNLKITTEMTLDAIIHDLRDEISKYCNMLFCDRSLLELQENPDYRYLYEYVFNVINNEQRNNEVLCQIDLVPNNVLIYKGRAKLIDHEYAGLLNRYWDLAAFISELHISFPTADFATLEKEFIEQYEKTTKFKVDMLEVKKWKVVVDFVWGVWGYAKTAAGQDFLQYGKSRLHTAASRLKGMNYENKS